jgi:ATP-dependent Zn protease
MVTKILNAKVRHTAFHEAGHAVVRMALTGLATAIDIHVDGRLIDGVSASGYSHGSGEVIDKTDAIGIALAGPIAEARARKISLIAAILEGGLQDQQEATVLAEELAGSVGAFCIDDTTGQVIRQEISVARRRILNQAELRAKRILRFHWQSVERIAAALLERRTLDAEGVRAAIDPALTLSRHAQEA